MTILKTDYIAVVIVMINILLRQTNIKTENIKKNIVINATEIMNIYLVLIKLKILFVYVKLPA